MGKIFAILGSGMQGTAVAYDLSRFAEPKEILIGDLSFEKAKKSSDRVNGLTGKTLCSPAHVDALNPEDLRKFLLPVDILVSAVPYWMHPKIVPIALETKTNMVDMGGNTDVAWKTLEFDQQAKAAEITLIPDTGLAPGLVNSLASYCLENFDETDSIKVYCGGLPEAPKPPFNYKLVFNIEGLLTEYNDQADAIRDGKLIRIDTLNELEAVHHNELGELEAFVTSGGTSTAPFTWEGRLKNFEYKTLRYPGHCEKMKIFKDFGFWSNEPIDLEGKAIRPRDLFNKLMGEALKDPESKDLVVIRCLARGKKEGSLSTLQIDLLEKYDPVTGFSGMERTTGFSTAIHAIEVARGHVEKGAIRYELAVSGTHFVKELGKRGIKVDIKNNFSCQV